MSNLKLWIVQINRFLKEVTTRSLSGFHPKQPKPEIPDPEIHKVPKYPRAKYPKFKIPKAKVPNVPK